jgi:hypothetical protein
MSRAIGQTATWEQTFQEALVAVRNGRPANPMEWLFDNPLGANENFTFAVLKKTYGGHKNSACLFGFHKLNPLGLQRDENGVPAKEFGCYKSDVVLPIDADDAMDSEAELLIAIEESATRFNPALLIYLTLSFPNATRMHHCWKEGMAFAAEAFARKRRLPVVIIQHRPGAAGSSNPVHLHLLVGPRQLDGTGFRGYADDILGDEGQQILFGEWMAFRGARGGER